MEIETEILAYNSQSSYPYIFTSTGDAFQILQLIDKPVVSFIQGGLISEIKVDYGLFQQTVKLCNTFGVQSRGLHTETKIDIKKLRQSDQEVIIRLQTDMNTSNGLFYTDQNGFQMMGRDNYPDRPTENNFNPVTAMVMLECKSRRLTLHTAQPRGAASYRIGRLEVM